ncbi:MAG: hypothetical protein O2887_11950 [Bacteroidetes bacterium]|nr:hypothetical protein [Bacteroidota bacterium]MDA1121184.1 hypothetical protein [Bacteroidota bacterium]
MSAEDSKSVIKIHRTLTRNEIKTIIEKYPNQDFEIHIGAGIDLPAELKTYNAEEYELPETRKKEINYSCLKKVKSFGDQNLGDQSVSEYLQYERLNIWYYNKFRIYFEYRNKAYKREEVKIAIGEFKKVVLFSEPNELITESPNLYWYKSSGKKSNLSVGLLAHYSIKVVTRILSSLSRKIPASIPNVILCSPNRIQPYLSIKRLVQGFDDFVIGYLLEEYPDRFLCIDEYQIPKFIKGSTLPKDVRFRHRKTIYGEYIMFKGILTFRLWKTSRNQLKIINKKLQSLWDKLHDTDYQFFISRLVHLKKSHWYFLMRYESYKKFFGSHVSFKNVISIDENSEFYKSVLDAAKSCNLKTIGIQHGNIYDLHVSYMFTEHDLINGPQVDKTLVWGQYWKDLLIQKGHYPPNSIAVTGQLRTDIIPILEKNNSTEVFTILFASQPQRDPNLRRRATRDMMIAAQNLEDSHLIIKLHPRETDHDFFNSMARSIGLVNFELSIDDDLYQMINESNVVVTCFSTVAGEAVYFGKPIIILDHLQQDLMGYYSLGVASQAINSETLTSFLVQIQSGTLSIDTSAYSKYIEKYAYKIDGRGSSRVMKEIEDNPKIP